MCSDSFQLQGMSERGFLPAIFNKRRWGCGLAGSLGLWGSAASCMAQVLFRGQAKGTTLASGCMPATLG